MRYFIYFCFSFYAFSSPVHDPALWRDKSKAEEFLRQGMDINGRNLKGETPLHIATRVGNRDTVRMLVAYGADPGLKDKKGKVPAQYARDPEVLKALVQGALVRQSLEGGSAFASQTEAGLCLDCRREERGTDAEVKLLSRQTCEQMMTSPECKNTHDLLKVDCQQREASTEDESHIRDMTFPWVCAGAGTSLSAVLTWGVFTRVKKALGKAGIWVTLGLSGLSAIYLSNQYEKAVRQIYHEARKLKWHRTFIYNRELMEGMARGRIYASFGEELHDTLYGDSLHCYNSTARMVRVCGAMAGLASVLTARGQLAGLSGAAPMVGMSAAFIGGYKIPYSQEELNRIFTNEFEKVRQDTLQKMKFQQRPSATKNVDRLLQEVTPSF